MDNDWKEDERLQNMDAGKLALLTKFAAELSGTAEDNRMGAFLELNRRMNQSGLTFTPSERELLFLILTERMSPEEQKKARLIKSLAGRLKSSP